MFELQRLLAKSRELPSTWVVDVGAIARRVAEHEKGGVKGSAIWDLLTETSVRSPHTFAWVQSMPGEYPSSFSTAELAVASMELLAWLTPDRIWIQSNETFISLASSIQGDFGVVAIDIDYYEEQLYVLNWHPTALIDVATGIVHTYPKDSTDSLNIGGSSRNKQPDRAYEPVFSPDVAAAAREDLQHPRKHPPGGKKASNNKRELNVALQDHGTMQKAQVRSDVVKQLIVNDPRIQARRKELLGNGVQDQKARQALQQFVTVSRPTITISSGSSLSTDPIVIVPLATGRNGSIAAQAWTNLTVFVGGRHVAGALPINNYVTEALTDLVRRFPNRWIVRRALDLARYMLSLGIELPKRLFDPALGAYALDPDHMKQTLARLQNGGELLPPEAAWLWDIKRKTAPPNQLLQVDASITLLIDEIEQQLANVGLTKLFQDDLELTLPVLARIEQHGAWVLAGGASSPDAELAHLQRRLTELERNFPKRLGDIDRYRSRSKALVDVLNGAALTIDPQYSAPYLKSGHILERLAHAHLPVRALTEARSLVSLFPYLEAMMGNSRLRGLLTPQRSGRFGYRALALGRLPKHFPKQSAFVNFLGLRLGIAWSASIYRHLSSDLLPGSPGTQYFCKPQLNKTPFGTWHSISSVQVPEVSSAPS